ncbi:MAG: hypothetical protein WC208_14005 [Gallionella sp.]|jgi:hypothetical protein
MEIKSVKKERTITSEWIEVLITPKDSERIVEVLNKIKEKGGKLDRYEEMIIGDLIIALQEPTIKVQDEKSGEATITEHPKPSDFQKVEETPHEGMTVAKKIAIVDQIKRRVDPKGDKDLRTVIKEIIDYAQKNMGITSAPKSNSPEAFYDWMVETGKINPDGSPKG